MGDVLGETTKPGPELAPICVGPGQYPGHIVWPYGLRCIYPGGIDNWEFQRELPRITAYPGIYNPNGYSVYFYLSWF